MRPYEFVPWETFLPRFERKWKQGEHMIVIGRTGNGKTTLIRRLLKPRKYVAVMVTKTHDPTFRKEFSDFEIQERWNPKPHIHPRVLLWPRGGSNDDLVEIMAAQKVVFKDALNQIFRDRAWCIVMDEAHWMTAQLGLGQYLGMFQHQARSSGLSVVSGVQRPALIPVITYGSASHAFIGRQQEPGDLRRLANLGGANVKELSAQILALPKYEYIYVNNTDNSPPVRTRVTL